MKFLIGIAENSYVPIHKLFEPIDADDNTHATDRARTVYGYDMLEKYPGMRIFAFPFSSLFIVPTTEKYIPLKAANDANSRNVGVIARNAQGIYLNAVRDDILSKRMLLFRDALPQFNVKPNPRDGVMGNGGGTGYANHIPIKSLQQAALYLERAGFNLHGELRFSDDPV
jgi:hypothetical protein